MEENAKNTEGMFQKVITSEIILPYRIFCSKFVEGIIDYLVGTTSYENTYMRVITKVAPRAKEESRMEICIKSELQNFKTKTKTEKRIESMQ